ncbi:MAG: DUF4013 domain-containing protein [Methanoculleaceae archaeon]
MNYEAMLTGSFEYSKDAVWGRWGRWALLVVCTIIFPLLYGYLLEVLRGREPAPELENWWTLFADGILYLVISIIYAIPILIVGLFAIFTLMYSISHGGLVIFSAGILVTIILSIIIGLIATIGIVRFARTGKFGEAFNFSEILATIRSIGWGRYILALIILYIVVCLASFVLNAIPYIGLFLTIVFYAPLAIFSARYISLLYDCGVVA